MSTETKALAVIEGGAIRLHTPEQILSTAQRAAQALMRIIEAKPKKVMMNGEVYLEIDDWETVAKFFNTTVRIVADERIDYGDVKGFKATAEAIEIIDGLPVAVGKAVALCLDDEENWGLRPKYDWVEELDDKGNKIWIDDPSSGKKRPKKKKVQSGETPTPTFQLLSMAQTRAVSKVYRLLFSWVIVLANNSGAKYATVPAEEMNTSTIEGGTPTSQAGTPKKEPPKGEKISDGQRKRMFALAREAGFNAEERVKEVVSAYGYAHSEDVVKGAEPGQYKLICEAIQDKNWKAPVASPAALGQAAVTPELISTPYQGKCLKVEELEGNSGPYLKLHFAGMELYLHDTKLFDQVRPATGVECKFICGKKEGVEGKMKLLTVLKVGDKEWLEDGTPVIQVDRGTSQAGTSPAGLFDK